jgi:chromosome partitioning protein
VQIIAVFNFKGGVGKTAAAVNLAFTSTLGGARTLIWDLDPQGAASFYFRIKDGIKGGGRKLVARPEKLPRLIRGTDFEGLDLVPADFSYRHLDLALDATRRPKKRLASLLAPLHDEYEYVFLDCPPAISLTSESVFAAAQVLLVPTVPTPLSLRTVQKLHRHFDKSGPPGLRTYVFFSMVDGRKGLHRATCAEPGAIPFEVLETRIPYASQVEQMGLHRQPVALYAPNCPAARAYAALWRELGEKLGGQMGPGGGP